MTYSTTTKRAIAKYGASACVRAFTIHSVYGEGAYTVAHGYDVAGITTTRAADAAINAGREIVSAEKKTA